MATPDTVAATVTLVVEIKGEKSSLQYLRDGGDAQGTLYGGAGTQPIYITRLNDPI
jgi:hypothetical protein